MKMDSIREQIRSQSYMIWKKMQRKRQLERQLEDLQKSIDDLDQSLEKLVDLLCDKINP